MKKFGFLIVILASKILLADAVVCTISEKDFSKSDSKEVIKSVVEKQINKSSEARYVEIKFDYNGEKFLYKANGSIQGIYKDDDKMQVFQNGQSVGVLKLGYTSVMRQILNNNIRTLIKCGLRLDSVNGPAAVSLFSPALSSVTKARITCDFVSKSDGLMKSCSSISSIKSDLTETRNVLSLNKTKFSDVTDLMVERIEEETQFNSFCSEDYKSETERVNNLNLARAKIESLCQLNKDIEFKLNL